MYEFIIRKAHTEKKMAMPVCIAFVGGNEYTTWVGSETLNIPSEPSAAPGQKVFTKPIQHLKQFHDFMTCFEFTVLL